MFENVNIWRMVASWAQWNKYNYLRNFVLKMKIN